MARLVFGPDVAICEYCARLVIDCLSHDESYSGRPIAGDRQERQPLVTASIAESSASARRAEPTDVPAAEHHRVNLAQRIIRFRTGVDVDRPHTLSETAEEFGLSRDQVRKLESEVLFRR
jgi:hypothetical protein